MRAVKLPSSAMGWATRAMERCMSIGARGIALKVASGPTQAIRSWGWVRASAGAPALGSQWSGNAL